VRGFSRDSTASVRTRRLLAFAALATIWTPVLIHLSLEWRLNEQYQFGFAVPLLAGYLFMLRWVTRPAAGARWLPVVTGAALGISLFPLLPLLLVGGANSDWRLLSWALTGIAVIVTLVAAGGAGGWRWVTYFAFPVAFVLVAVPWPMQLETELITRLTRLSAEIATEVLNLLGMPAHNTGSLIQIGAELVGVDEACSGVRSLQTTIMSGLLFGEIYRLSASRRIVLLIGACMIAAAWNLGRTLVLVGVTAQGGAAAMEAWHDHVGLAALIASLGSVIVFARTVRQRESPSAAARDPNLDARIEIFPPAFSAGTIAWAIFSIVFVECWYRTGRSGHPSSLDRAQWTVMWPSNFRGMHEVPIPSQTWRLMKFTSGVNRVWSDEGGHMWSAYYLEWAPSRAAQALAHVHSPEKCLPAAGMKLVQDLGVENVEAGAFRIPFRRYHFDDRGTPLYVYFSLQSLNRSTLESGGSETLSWRSRMAAVREGRRNPGQQQLEIGVWGFESEDDSRAAVQRLVAAIVVPRV
jgi:exosortase